MTGTDRDQVVVIGIRHHSPACARVVAETIERLRPTHVLIEGPADYTDRLADLAREHTLPIALFTHRRRGTHTRVAWQAFTDFSPEWVALRSASKVGAEVTFIDLPAWHREFDTAPERYGSNATAAAKRWGLDTVDAMWDHVVESRAHTLTTPETIEVLDTYFDTIRDADTPVSEREKYMAEWVGAVCSTSGRGPVVVVCGGFHRPAIVAELASAPQPRCDAARPMVPTADTGTDVGSYLVPYSYPRLMLESPWWYEQLWHQLPRYEKPRDGTASVSNVATDAIVRTLRHQGHPVSTTAFIGFRTQMRALAAMRGHHMPTRRDILDAAASTLIDEALASPLPWTLTGEPAGTQPHPVITSCLRTMRGDRRGTLHPDSPAPGLVHHVDMLLEEFDLDVGAVTLDLTDDRGRARSRILHQLRLLGIPGFERTSGPSTGAELHPVEQWLITEHEDRIAALTEAAAQGHTLLDAAGTTLDTELRAARSDVTTLARILFDAVLCGLDTVSDQSATAAAESVNGASDLGAVGVVLRTALDLWRHDSLFGGRGSTLLGTVVAVASSTVLTLARRARVTTGGADRPRIAAIAALADALRYAGPLLTYDPADELALLARDTGAALDMRGAALGTAWDRSTPAQAATAVRSVPPDRLGDWLSGLFGVARESFLDAGSSDAVLGAVDEVVSGLTEHDFLTALPALRQSFEFFPPRERSIIARRLTAPAPDAVHHYPVEAGARLDEQIDSALEQIGLL